MSKAHVLWMGLDVSNCKLQSRSAGWKEQDQAIHAVYVGAGKKTCFLSALISVASPVCVPHGVHMPLCGMYAWPCHRLGPWDTEPQQPHSYRTRT